MSSWCGADCIWFSLCHCIPKPHHLLPHFNPDWFYLPFWYWLTQVVLEKRPLNGCSSSSLKFRKMTLNTFSVARLCWDMSRLTCSLTRSARSFHVSGSAAVLESGTEAERWSDVNDDAMFNCWWSKARNVALVWTAHHTSCHMLLFDKCNSSHAGCVTVITSTQSLLVFLQCVWCYKRIAYFTVLYCERFCESLITELLCVCSISTTLCQAVIKTNCFYFLFVAFVYWLPYNIHHSTIRHIVHHNSKIDLISKTRLTNLCSQRRCERQTAYLFQRISVTLQRFNSVLLHDTLPVDLPDL